MSDMNWLIGCDDMNGDNDLNSDNDQEDSLVDLRSESEMPRDLEMAATARGIISSPGTPAHLINQRLMKKRWSLCAKHPLGKVVLTLCEVMRK